MVDRHVVLVRIAKNREYMDIDRRRVYAILERELVDFEAFIRAVTKRL